MVIMSGCPLTDMSTIIQLNSKSLSLFSSKVSLSRASWTLFSLLKEKGRISSCHSFLKNCCFYRKRQSQRTWIFGKVLDPRSDMIRRGNRWFLFGCGFGAAVDPLFLSVLSVNTHLSCLYVQVCSNRHYIHAFPLLLQLVTAMLMVYYFLLQSFHHFLTLCKVSGIVFQFT